MQPELTLPAPLGDGGEWSDPAHAIPFRPQRARAVLGISEEALSDGDIAGILERLGFGVDRTDSPWSVAIPSARATKDIGIEEDLIEEVGRIYRYARIPDQSLVGELTPPRQEPLRLFVRRLQDRLAGTGDFCEAMTHGFQHESLTEALGLTELEHVTVLNPCAEGLDRIRRSVAPSLIGLVAENLRNRDEVRLFEVGRGYLPEEQDERALPREVVELAVVLAAPKPADGARFDTGALPRLQGVLEDLVAHLERGSVRWAVTSEDLPPWAHPARSGVGTVADDVAAIRLTALDPGYARDLGIEAEVAVASVDVLALLAAPELPLAYEALPRFPGVKIDVALAVPAELPAAEVLGAIERSGKGLVKETELFDLYTGEQAGEGRKSLAWHVLLQSPSKTLSDKDGAKFLGRLEREIDRLGGVLRRE